MTDLRDLREKPGVSRESRTVAAQMLDEGMTRRCALLLSVELRDALTPIVASVHLMDPKTASYVQEGASRICTMLDDLTSALPMGAGLLAETVRESPDDARALAQMMRRLAEGHASPRYPNRPRILMALARLLEDRLAVELMHASETKTQ